MSEKEKCPLVNQPNGITPEELKKYAVPLTDDDFAFILAVSRLIEYFKSGNQTINMDDVRNRYELNREPLNPDKPNLE